MLRKPKKSEVQVKLRKEKTTRRFQIVKLEERIAPRHMGRVRGCGNSGGAAPWCA
jgi:hypothetical protein